MTLAHVHNRARRTVARATLIAALTLPTAAVAAESPAETPPAEIGPSRHALTPLNGPFPSAIEAEAAQDKKAEKKTKNRERAEKGPFHPVDGKVGYGDVMAAFGHARGRPHEGQDVFAPAGTPLVSPTETVVVDAGTDGGRGNWVALYDAKREQTYSYFHLLAPAKPGVGEKLKPGEKVGEIGCTGSCSGDHLHFEVLDGKGPYGTPRDPMPLLAKWERV